MELSYSYTFKAYEIPGYLRRSVTETHFQPKNTILIFSISTQTLLMFMRLLEKFSDVTFLGKVRL